MLGALPRYHIVKRQVRCDSRRGYRALDFVQAHMLAQADGGQMDLTDGFRMDWADGWIHARASQTEQLVRVISEAQTRAVAEQRADELIRLIEQEM